MDAILSKAIQLREQKEKDQLLEALNSIKALSSKESIEQFKREAQTHFFWTDNAKYFPFSWHELPCFVNVDIPNGDWIFGCDRRIWQAAFYKSFILNSRVSCKPFCVKSVDNWLQNKVGCKVHQSVKTAGRCGRLHPQTVPANISANLPSSWKTLRAYFNYLCDLGMLKFSGNDYHNPGNDWFRVVGEQPILPDRRKRSSLYESPGNNQF